MLPPFGFFASFAKVVIYRDVSFRIVDPAAAAYIALVYHATRCAPVILKRYLNRLKENKKESLWEIAVFTVDTRVADL